MRLSTKLRLSFCTIIAMLLVFACFSWNATLHLNKQEHFIVQADDIITNVSETKTNAIASFAEAKPEILKAVTASIEEARKNIDTLPNLTDDEKSLAIIKESQEIITKFKPIIANMHSSFMSIREVDDNLTILGGKINAEFAKVEKALLQNAIGVQQEYVTTVELKNLIALVRITTANYLNAKTPESLEASKQSVENIKSFMANLPPNYTFLDSLKKILLFM